MTTRTAGFQGADAQRLATSVGGGASPGLCGGVGGGRFHRPTPGACRHGGHNRKGGGL